MMNGKDQNVEYSSNENLHDNTTLTPFDSELTHSGASANKRTIVASPGERKASKHLFSQSHEISEDSSNLGLVNKGNIRDSSRYSDLSASYNTDVTSTYALQIALKSMKERYQKLQKKISVLEEENGRLISGKSELFGEIGKMQESSIKLREKNLQLNHEVHSKHQECCSLKDQFSALSKENLKLTTELSQSTNESKKLSKEVEELVKENRMLKNSLEEILSHCRKSPVHTEFLSHIERIVKRSLNRSESNLFTKTKIIPHAEDFEHLDEFKTMAATDAAISSESFDWDSAKDSETLSLGACLKAKEMMRKVRDLLQKQNQDLTELNPILFKVSKRKLDSDVDDSGDQGRTYLSRLATCGSATNPSGMGLSSEDRAMCANLMEDSGGETNVLVEEFIEESEKKVPFDWRKVEVSDDETTPFNRPETRTVSTSPDLTLTFDLDTNHGTRELSSDEDRTCPMCNAIFPLLLSQETFESHVVSHFEVENGFEVIT